MTETQLNLEDFPDSPYAAELRRGVSARAFPPDLEAQYLGLHLARVKVRVRLWFLVSLIAAIGFSLAEMRTGAITRYLLLEFALLVVPAMLMLLVTWSRFYHRWFMQAASIVVPITQTVLVVYLAQAVSEGRVTAIGALVLNSFAVFFFSGLMFRLALIAAIGMLLGFGVATQYYGIPPEIGYAGLALMVLTIFLAAIVYRGTEIAYRKGFLERVLVRDLAARDGLTGVMNRRAFDEHLLRVWQQGLRDKRHIGLIMIDIDHFKAYNDFHGHQAGDAALRQVARVIMGFARRPLDMAARYGGEEFVMALYDLTEDQIGKIAEQLRSAVAALQIEHRAGTGSEYVTVSVGVAFIQPAIGRTPKGAVQFADEALYQAKEAGRDRIVVRKEEDYRQMKTGTFSSPQTIRLRP